jgi:hypothetical protein
LGLLIFLLMVSALAIWGLVDGRKHRRFKIDRAVKAILDGRSADESDQVPEIEIVTRENLKFHDRFQKRAEELGFSKLGDLLSGKDKTGDGRLTRVMVDREGTSLLAYARLNSPYVDEQIEMETWLRSGEFLYSTNNPYFYAIKQPAGIKVNPVKSREPKEVVESHGKFVASFRNVEFNKYGDIQSVISCMKIQSEWKRNQNRGKELSMDEDEMRTFIESLGKRYHKDMLEEIYKRVRKRLADADAKIAR